MRTVSGVRGGFDRRYSVCPIQAYRREQQPQEKPEKVERQAEDSGMNAVPQRNGETKGDEGHRSEEQ